MKNPDYIWYNKGEYSMNNACGTTEMNMKDINKKFIESTIKCFVDALRIPYGSRDIVESLIYSATIDSIESLLEQYLHNELEILADTFNKKFSMDEKINFSHVTHAKMNNIIEGIMKRYEPRKNFDIRIEVENDK